ncbi:MAG: NADH-quinone oxidoreductase subunit NuoG [Chloroflexi bacterium]|nr:NADH-quinone oxidoreductase subunit NuoG [Chloroflexota bacterium]MBP8059649.1 NADH-quinone oxidoreductase subunit NuoG [Chloroflexota bacterium]
MSDLVKITVDGVEVSVPKGEWVVDAAKRIQNDIPVFCYHPKMAPVGMCRMCLVEIGLPVRDRATGAILQNPDGTPQLNFGKGLQTACTVQVAPDMVVRTSTKQVEEARAGIIEFLLTSHPLDCPICDKGGECPLQNLTMEHGVGTSRFDFSSKMKQDKHVPLGDLIYLDRERCIQCARCTRFQAEVVDDPVIGFHNRGRSLEIMTLSDPGFDSYWSGNTTDICPVGALTTADFRFGARPWELIPVASLDPYSPAGSNIVFSTRIEAKAEGRTVIKRVLPRQNEAVNEIWIDDRTRFGHHFAESPNRLTKPLVRKNGRLTEATWDEALQAVADGLSRNKGSVAGLSNDRVSNEALYLFQNLIRRGLGSNHLDLSGSRLAGGDVTAKVGLSKGSNLKNLGKGDAILVVASDLHEEVPIWWLRVKQAAERGATLIVMNMRPTRLDKQAKQVIHYAPGEALSTVHSLVNAAKVESEGNEPLSVAAASLIKAQNLVIFYGYEGLAYSETDTLARILANLLLLKNSEGQAHAGRVNNGLIAVWPHNNTQGAWDMGIHPAFEPGYKALSSRGMGEREIVAAAATGDIRTLYLLGADPVGDGLMAERGKLDFLVVQELFLTPTAQLADVVLPAQSWAEHDGTFTSGERRVQRFYPAITSMGESRPDWQIIAQISEKLGLGKAPIASSLVFRDMARAVPQYKGLDYRLLAQVEKQWPDVGGSDLYYGGTSYTNKSGLGQQWAAEGETKLPEPYAIGDTARPDLLGLQLITSVALYNGTGTLLREAEVLRPRLAQPTIFLHETDAQSRKIAAGDTVEVSINGANLNAVAHINGHVPAGLAVLRGTKYISGLQRAAVHK